MKKLLLILVAVLLVWTTVGAQGSSTYPKEIRPWGISFGSSKATVRKLMQAKGAEELKGDSDDKISLFFHKAPDFSSISTEGVLFEFTDRDSLARFHLLSQGLSESFFMGQYDSLKNALEEKYGEPFEDTTKYKYPYSDRNTPTVDMINRGYFLRNTMWVLKTPQGLIGISIRLISSNSNPNEAAILVSYVDNSLSAIISQAQSDDL